ncbi:arsenic resistance protein [Clostridium botulinum]|uniref:arsenic resistance protein n=1 Tax=Clostridium botulinum TaxID=1491 RepID=UPI0006A6FB55|nr:hypothetical protein [Clostridium botulinum]KON10435.1 hypothetical protein ACP52_06445 [Clostridium botulinum]
MNRAIENKKEKKGLGVFERYLTIWVALCIVVGILIGRFIPQIPETLNKFEYYNVSIPVAVLIWLMIYPMMLKIDFSSIVGVTKKPKGLIVTCVTNWLIKPFTMYLIASFFLKVVFKTFIPSNLATEYLAGAVLLGAAPCTAMVFVWSYLTKGDAAYTLVQVAVNDLIILVAFALSLFGLKSGAALATVVGVLTEVPIMLTLVRIANNTRGWFSTEIIEKQ